MSTERSNFGLNSILPSAYRNKAEAFAKCLQDKLRSLSGLDDPTDNINGRGLLDVTPATPHGSLSKYSEEEITDSVFLQGPLAYKRRSIPERTGPPPTNGRYMGSVTDRRGFSSDSEDSDNEDFSPAVENAVHRRIAQLQNQQQTEPGRRLTSTNSIDSTTSWCSCEEPDDDDDDEVIDSLASQIKGSPTIHNPRLRNFKRKGSKSTKEEIPASAPAENDLFFDFDVECFSPVNLDGEGEDTDGGFDTARLRFITDDVNENEREDKNIVDTGQLAVHNENEPAKQEVILTPPTSPAQEIFKSAQLNAYPALQLLDTTEVTDGNINKKEDDCDIDNSVVNLNEVREEQQIVEDCSLAESTLRGQSEVCTGPSEEIQDLIFSETPQDPFETVEKHETETNEKEVLSEEEECGAVAVEKLSEDTSLAVNDEIILLHEGQSEQQQVVQEDTVDIAVEVEECVVISENIDKEESVVDEATAEVQSNTAEECLDDSEELRANEPYNSSEENLETKVPEGGIASIVITKCNDDNDDTENVITPRMKLRRCSSLKTWKTPPGTPGRKKIVRFADALGLDLADVRTFLDELPKIPKSAFEDLNFEPTPVVIAPPPVERTLIPMFQQPGTQMDFIQKVRQNNVSLESAVLSDVSLLAISGMVRVRNLSFHKSVHIRYTKDSWVTLSDLQATYIPGSSDGFCDNFSFTLYGHTLSIGDRLEFAIRYECGAGQFWDNNSGINYIFQCMPRSPVQLFPPLGSSPVDSWTNFY